MQRRLHRRQHRDEMCAEAVDALNLLAGAGEYNPRANSYPAASHARVREFIHDAFRQLGPPPTGRLPQEPLVSSAAARSTMTPGHKSRPTISPAFRSPTWGLLLLSFPGFMETGASSLSRVSFLRVFSDLRRQGMPWAGRFQYHTMMRCSAPAAVSTLGFSVGSSPPA